MNESSVPGQEEAVEMYDASVVYVYNRPVHISVDGRWPFCGIEL